MLWGIFRNFGIRDILQTFKEFWDMGCFGIQDISSPHKQASLVNKFKYFFFTIFKPDIRFKLNKSLVTGSCRR